MYVSDVFVFLVGYSAANVVVMTVLLVGDMRWRYYQNPNTFWGEINGQWLANVAIHYFIGLFAAIPIILVVMSCHYCSELYRRVRTWVLARAGWWYPFWW